MATTKDLANLIDRKMGKGQGPFLVRICQDASLLPRVKRGGWRSMVHLTAEHLADFIIGVSGTRSAGERNAYAARAAVDRFANLVWAADSEKSLRADLAELIRNGTPKDAMLLWILFVNHPTSPEVEMRFFSRKADSQNARNYNDPKNDLAMGFTDAFMVYGDLIWGLQDLLTVPEKVEAG